MLDRFPVSALQDRYGIGKTALYDRLKALQIQPQREGNRSFISQPELTLMDELNEFVREGGSTPDFVRSMPDREPGTLAMSGTLAPNNQPDWMALLMAFAAMQEPRQPDPLAPHRMLEEVVAKGWIVTTSQLRQILSIDPVEGNRLGFHFTKAGRQGREMGWKVSKAFEVGVEMPIAYIAQSPGILEHGNREENRVNH